MRKLPKTKLVVTYLAFAILLSSCSFLEKSNSLTSKEYRTALMTEPEALVANNLAEFDDTNSFEVGISSSGESFGDSENLKKMNWGNIDYFVNPSCEYEYFWGASTKRLTKSDEFLTISSSLKSIKMTISNYNQANFGLASQNILSFKKEKIASQYFAAIQSSFRECSANVYMRDLMGRTAKAPFTNERKAKLTLYQPNKNVLVRVSRDGLIHLEIFSLSRFSVVAFQLFLNDDNLGSEESWAVLNSLINNTMTRISIFEGNEYTPVRLEQMPLYYPNGDKVTYPSL